MPLILVPCKSLARGKSRLSGVLSPEAREALCRQFLADTLRNAIAVAGEGSVKLISTDPQAQAMAAAFGVGVDATAWPDLNAALSGVRRQLLATPPARDMLVLPIDLPLSTPDALRRVLETAGDVVLVPDRRDAGTNVLLLRAAALNGFCFAYGSDSFRTHAAQAAARQLDLGVLRDKDLAFDIDEPEDYRLWKSLQR